MEATCKRIAPISIEQGIRNLWSSPNNILPMCGEINPINPIIPANETATAVKKEETIKIFRRNFFTLIPKASALSSPNLNEVSIQVFFKAKIKQQKDVMNITLTFK